MNPFEFHCSRGEEDRLEFIEGILKITQIIDVTTVERINFVTYHLKGVAQFCNKQGKDDKVVCKGPG